MPSGVCLYVLTETYSSSFGLLLDFDVNADIVHRSATASLRLRLNGFVSFLFVFVNVSH